MNIEKLKKWAWAAFIRGIRTFAEGILVYIGGDAVNVGKLVLADVNWVAALSAGAFGFIVAIVLALAGLPEVKMEEVHPPE
jgi:hypothetical protein